MIKIYNLYKWYLLKKLKFKLLFWWYRIDENEFHPSLDIFTYNDHLVLTFLKSVAHELDNGDYLVDKPFKLYSEYNNLLDTLLPAFKLSPSKIKKIISDITYFKKDIR